MGPVIGRSTARATEREAKWRSEEIEDDATTALKIEEDKNEAEEDAAIRVVCLGAAMAILEAREAIQKTDLLKEAMTSSSVCAPQRVCIQERWWWQRMTVSRVFPFEDAKVTERLALSRWLASRWTVGCQCEPRGQAHGACSASCPPCPPTVECAHSPAF